MSLLNVRQHNIVYSCWFKNVSSNRHELPYWESEQYTDSHTNSQLNGQSDKWTVRQMDSQQMDSQTNG